MLKLYKVEAIKGFVLRQRANFVGTNGGSEGGAGIHFPHTPFSSRPARAVSLAREARRQFRSKNVRAELYNSTN